MMRSYFHTLADLLWPSLEGNTQRHEREEESKLEEERLRIAKAAANLPSDEDILKEHLASSEKLLEGERSRKSSIEARLLNMAGLVSIAGTVVLGTLFSLATEKLPLDSGWARITLTMGCLYLAIQLIAALRASVRGLQAIGYTEDQPHALLLPKGLKRTVFLRERIEQILIRVAEHRRVTNKKLDQLNIAHHAMRNFLLGLLTLAIAACMITLLRPHPSTSCHEDAQCGKPIGELRLEFLFNGATPQQQTIMQRIVTIGPFPDGDHLLVQEQVAQCVQSVMAQYKGLSIGGWEVVGRVDKRQLTWERAAVYGSNQTLAMSRASWVAQQILTPLPTFDMTHAVILVGGAQSVGTSVSINDLQSDRAVDVFALINSTAVDAALINLPKPAICPHPESRE